MTDKATLWTLAIGFLLTIIGTLVLLWFGHGGRSFLTFIGLVVLAELLGRARNGI